MQRFFNAVSSSFRSLGLTASRLVTVRFAQAFRSYVAVVSRLWTDLSEGARAAMLEARLARDGQRGAISVYWIEALFIGIVLLVVVIQFLLQQGLPMIISAGSNTTALTAAGASAAQVSWVTFIVGAIVIFMLVGLLVIGIRVAMGANGGGGGGGRRRGRRRRK